MGVVDFIRNLLLSSFHDEAMAIDMYKRHWLVIELSMGAKSLEHMFDSFLRDQPETAAPLPAELLHVPVGGQLYPRFRRWLAAALCAGAPVSINAEGRACTPLENIVLVGQH